MTMANTISEYLSSLETMAAPLHDIYENVCGISASKTPKNSIRRAIYENPERFRSVERGVWMVVGEKTRSLIIEGDGRKMESLRDTSIDCIITDHPWESKSNRGGNRKFATYETFRYTQADFDAKARVLKPGAFLVEFLPVETEANWRYIADVKEMAYAAGFRLYASCIWRKAWGGANTGRTTKGVEQIIIFSKGEPRRLSPKGKPYMTRSMLEFEVDITIARKGKVHTAEKPIRLYEYLIENLTEEREIILDQFGGSCNAAKAAINTNRFGVVFEKCHDYTESAVRRFGATLVGRVAAQDSVKARCKAQAQLSLAL